MRCIAICAGFAVSATPLASAEAQALLPAPVFEGKTTTPIKSGATQPVHITVQSWEIAGQRNRNGPSHGIPLHGFYVAHLLSGDISTTIDGQTTKHFPGDYWTVKTGATMQVKVLGEFAVLETIVVAKQ
jgi:quercetin dioxygenase-like cupin family protein